MGRAEALESWAPVAYLSLINYVTNQSYIHNYLLIPGARHCVRREKEKYIRGLECRGEKETKSGQ